MNKEPEPPEPVDLRTQIIIVVLLVLGLAGIIVLGRFGYVSAASETQRTDLSTKEATGN